ncbi:MAG: amphi-Trp domain-containing protein [Acidimicrobiales bacterium]
MDLIEIEAKRHLSREEAADWLRNLADSLSRHNDIEFEREGVRYEVAVPDELLMEIELEIGDDGTELEIEFHW